MVTMMKDKTVFIVLDGMDCEGALVQAVFSNEKDAVDYLDKHYPNWKRISPIERRSTCESAFVEEWEVK